MADYSEYSIVAEEGCICVRKPELIPDERYNVQKCKTVPRCLREGGPTGLCFCTQHTSWEITVRNWAPKVMNIEIMNIHKAKDTKPMLAEVVKWRWGVDNNQKMEKYLFNKNDYKCNSFPPIDNDIHFIIRLLEKRKLVGSLCPPLDFLASDDAFTISVGDQTFVVSACRLMQVSPVFRRMLTVEMREKTERKVDIKDAEPEHFRAFLEVIDPDQNVHPNPTNVVGVLKLADRYQVELAKDRCERHLINCVEIPLIERLQLAHTYRLNKLKESILSIGSVQLRALYNANFDELKKCQNGIELLGEMNLRLRENE